jgi:rhodanese-related sulfurtransferase
LGRLWLLNARSMETRTLALPQDAGCPVCSQPRNAIRLTDAPALCAASLSITCGEAAAMTPDALFIDVREAHELLSGKIPGAVHIPLGTLLTDDNSLNAIPQGRPVVVYCQHGMRSLRGANHLRGRGYGQVTSLEGGIVRWKGNLVK